MGDFPTPIICRVYLVVEIMDILRVKKAHLPESTSPPTRQRKERKVSNPGVVMDGLSVGAGKEAGSSNGPGTIEQSGSGDGSTEQ